MVQAERKNERVEACAQRQGADHIPGGSILEY